MICFIFFILSSQTSVPGEVVVDDKDGAVEADEEGEGVEDGHAADRIQEQHRVVEEGQH